MRKTILVTCGIILAGILSYFGGYYFYDSVNSKSKTIEPISVQRTILLQDNKEEAAEEHYHIKIEQDLLVIYKIPENIIYDSIRLSSLHLTESEYAAFSDGIDFYSLTEVFEFLENSMS